MFSSQMRWERWQSDVVMHSGEDWDSGVIEKIGVARSSMPSVISPIVAGLKIFLGVVGIFFKFWNLFCGFWVFVDMFIRNFV